MRTISTQRAASSAASGLKWMSATMGTRQPRARSAATMFSRLAASLTVGAVMRTIWQPTATKSSVCRTHSAVSMVSQVSMDCTTTGWRPPMITPPRCGSPTMTSRVRRRRKNPGESQCGTMLSALRPVRFPVSRW